MRTPSTQTLARVFSNPTEAKRIFRMGRAQLLETAAGAARERECMHAPKTWDLRMHVLDSIEPGLCGLESLAGAREDSRGIGSEEYAEYLNAGDSYADTVIYWRGNYRVQSVGDFIETMERQGVKFL